jgi:hypothetical protein
MALQLQLTRFKLVSFMLNFTRLPVKDVMLAMGILAKLAVTILNTFGLWC